VSRLLTVIYVIKYSTEKFNSITHHGWDMERPPAVLVGCAVAGRLQTAVSWWSCWPSDMSRSHDPGLPGCPSTRSLCLHHQSSVRAADKPRLSTIKLSHTRLRALDTHPAGDISHKPGGRLPLHSTRPTVTFPAKQITPLGRYQIILLGDRGTRV